MGSCRKARETLVVCHTVFQSTVNTVEMAVEMGVIHCMGYSVPTWFDREKCSTFVQIFDQIGGEAPYKIGSVKCDDGTCASMHTHTHTLKDRLQWNTSISTHLN